MSPAPALSTTLRASACRTGVPVGGAGTLSVTGDMKEMSADFIQAAVFEKYGVSMFVGIGVPIPVLDEAMLRQLAVRDAEIFTGVTDYGVPSRKPPHAGPRKLCPAEIRPYQLEWPASSHGASVQPEKGPSNCTLLG